MTVGRSPRLVATAVLGVAWALMPAALGFTLLANIAPASLWLRDLGSRGLALYVVIFALTSGFGLLPTYAQAVLGGWVFGLVWGVPAALLGFVGGATIGFLVARLIGHEALRERIDAHPKARVIREALVARSFWHALGTVTLLRLPPNSPFALTNLAMAGAGVRLAPFALGTLLGMTPRTALMVGLGAAGAASGATDLQAVIRERGIWQVIAMVVVTAIVLVVLAAIARSALRRAGLDGQPAAAAPTPVDTETLPS